MDNLPTKKDILENFKNNETAKEALSSISDEKQKRVISAIAENFISELYDTFFKINAKFIEDPAAFEKLAEQFGTNVITVDSNKSTEKTNAENKPK